MSRHIKTSIFQSLSAEFLHKQILYCTNTRPFYLYKSQDYNEINSYWAYKIIDNALFKCITIKTYLSYKYKSECNNFLHFYLKIVKIMLHFL